MCCLLAIAASLLYRRCIVAAGLIKKLSRLPTLRLHILSGSLERLEVWKRNS